jgi:hypothetical protein
MGSQITIEVCLDSLASARVYGKNHLKACPIADSIGYRKYLPNSRTESSGELNYVQISFMVSEIRLDSTPDSSNDQVVE